MSPTVPEPRPLPLLDFHRNRASYLTLAEARERIKVHRRRIEKYRAEGLPAYRLGRKLYVREDELLELWRAKRKRDDGNTAYAHPELPNFESG